MKRNQTFRNRIVKWKHDQSLTHQEAIAKLGIPFSTWNKWYFGVSEPSQFVQELLRKVHKI